MKITYISHSGFLVETEKENYLFDYYKGEIPEMAPEKPLFVFASHRHADHFNPEIFGLTQKYQAVTFVLSYDIKIKPYNLEKWHVDEETAGKIVTVRANEVYEIGDFRLHTLKSTDEGVAFFLKTPSATIYHAGDLHWWYWEEEDKSFNNNMTASFKREIEKLTALSKNAPIDVAFVPLDPRQEADYYLGLDYLLQKIKVNYVFPMHFWGDFSVMDRFIEEGHGSGKADRIVKIGKDGESFTIR